MTSPPDSPGDDRPPDDAPGARRGGRPSKGPRKPFLLRLPPELLDELRGWASHEMRSLNSHLEYLLREALRRRRGGDDRRD